MTFATDLPRLVAAALATALTLSLVAPSSTLAATTTDPELLVTLELPTGDVDYLIELGTLYIYDEEDTPFAISVIDGCSVNDQLWVFGAGLSGIPVPLDVMDLRSGESARVALPAFEPGNPIGTVLEPDSLPVCGDGPTGGLPPLRGIATLTSADGRSGDYDDAFEVRSDGDDGAYRRLIRGGSSYPIISKGSPIIAIDDSNAFDELVLMAEGRTPRQVEGVVFFGEQGMLPARAALDKALGRVDRARVKRAFETARNMRVPQGIIEDLGLSGVEQVHHVSLDLETLGSDAYLAQAGWIRDRGRPIEPPVPVEERFAVQIARADGETVDIPLVGPLVGSEAEGRLWEYRADDTLVQVIDACDLGDFYWLLAGARTEEPLELRLTDKRSASTTSQLLWTDREDVSRLTEGSLLPCP